jgi:hypothetical protein
MSFCSEIRSRQSSNVPQCHSHVTAPIERALICALCHVVVSVCSIVLYALVALVSKLNSYSVALSYVADVSTLEQRSGCFGEVSGVMFLGLTGGPFVSSFLDRSTALISAAILNIASALYILFLLPETHGEGADKDKKNKGEGKEGEKRGLLADGKQKKYDSSSEKDEKKSSSKKSHSHSHGGEDSDEDHDHEDDSDEDKSKKKKAKSHGPLMAWYFLTQNKLFLLIGLITLISQFAIFGVGQVYYLYLTEELGFAREDTIRAALIGGIETSFVMLLLMPWLSHHIHESLLMEFGLASYVIYALGLSLAASSKGQAFAIILFWSLSGLLFPSTCSLLSAHTSGDQTGLAQGALSAVRCCASGLGPALFALFFSQMVELKHKEMGAAKVNYAEDEASLGWGVFSVHYTALPFVFGALLIVIAMVLTMYLPSTRLHPTKRQELLEEQGKGSSASSSKSSSKGPVKGSDGRHLTHQTTQKPLSAHPKADAYGFVRRRDGGHLLPGISGSHTFVSNNRAPLCTCSLCV